MKQTFADLFSSKKFIVMIAAVVAYVTARLGFDVHQGDAENLLLLVGVWLGAQGAADLGKSSATVKSKAGVPIHRANTIGQPAKPDVGAQEP